METKRELTQALRFNENKVRYDLLPPYAIHQLACVMTKGAEKYAPINWEKGMEWSKCLASLKRHIAKFEMGIDNDEETGLLHLAHAMTNCAFLIEYYKIYPQGDDRSQAYKKMPKIGLDIDDVICDFIGGMKAKFDLKDPLFWCWSYGMADMLKTSDELDDFYLSLKPLIDPKELLFEPACYITSRPINKSITEKWIERHRFACAPVYSVNMEHSKVQCAKEAGIDIFIDDKFENFAELNNAGINTYLLTRDHNKKYDVGHKRIDNVNEVITRYKQF